MPDLAPRVRLLGPLELVGDDETLLVVPEARQRRVLTQLALDAGALVPSHVLAALPAVGSDDLAAVLGSLRAVAGEDLIEVEPTGARLACDDVDIRHVERLAELVLDPGRDGDTELLGQALALWRGEPLAEFAGEPWADAARARLESLRSSMVEGRAEALLHDGRALDVIAELEADLRLGYARSDRSQELLMRALVASERPTAALESYREHVRRLARHGSEPSATLRSFERRVAYELGSSLPPAQRPRPTGEITVVFTDIAGSTRLWGDHPGLMALNLARHDEIVRDLIDRHHGYVFSTAGDSFGIAFQLPDQAMAFAVELQQRLAAEPWPDEANIHVRAGVHTGTANERDGNYFGNTLNLAARIEEAANPGQILVSSTVVDQAGDTLAVRDLGRHVLRDIADPVRLFQVDVPGADNDHPPVRTVGTSITNLPAARGQLRGREEATVEVRELLHQHRVVTLAGPGGIGKTRLAVHVAGTESLDPQTPVVFVDLGSPSVDVDMAFLAAFGLSPSTTRDAVHQLVPLLLGRRLLLVVDNCEHVLDAVAARLDELLDRAPDLVVLATSREPFGLVGERVWRVPPLAADPDGPAVQLFEERAGDVDPGFRLDSTNLDLVVDLCLRLDGLPLAIELAASRMAAMTVADIIANLDDRFRLLRTVRGRPERHRTLEEVIRWSYDLCTPGERELLERLTVFPRTFARDDVAGVTGVDRAVADGVLDALVARSLVQVVRLPGNRLRYHLLESIREFGRSQHADESVTVRDRDRHLEHFLRTQGAPPDLDLAQVDRRIELPEYDNIRAAADWALERGDALAATRLTIGRTVAIVEHGGADRAIAWLSGRRELDTNDHLWALNGCAYAAVALGDHLQAAAFVEEAVALADGGPFDALPNLFCFAALNELVDDPERALPFIERALLIAPATPSGDRHLVTIYRIRSLVHLHRRAVDDAVTSAVASQERSHPSSPYWGAATVSRITALLMSGQDEAARELLASVERPARWGAHEWAYRLCDLALDDTGTHDVRDAARVALLPTGREPVQQSRDLLAAVALGELRRGDAVAAERDAAGALSGSVFGALAFDLLARLRHVDDDSWPGWRTDLGRRIRDNASRDRAVELVRSRALA